MGAPLGAGLHRLLRPGPAVDALSGKALGHPAHPALVSAPIGCWTGALVADLAGEPRAGRVLTGLGVLSALPVAATGASDWADTTGAEQRVGVVHLGLNLAATVLYGGVVVGPPPRPPSPRGGRWESPGRHWPRRPGGWAATWPTPLGVGVDTNAFDGGPTEWTGCERPIRRFRAGQQRLGGGSKPGHRQVRPGRRQ